MGATVDNLEIKIETSAKSSLEYLGKVQDKLNDITSSLKSVLTLSSNLGNLGKIDLKGFEDTKKQLDVISKKAQSISKQSVSPKINTKEIDKAAQSLDDLFDKYKNAGRNLNLSDMGLSDLEREAVKTEKTVKRLNDRLEKKVSLEGTERLGKSWESLVFDIQKATNQAEIYREAIDKIKNTVPKLTITRGTPNESNVSNTNAESKTVQVSPESLNYDADAMKMVFGEEAVALRNFNDVMEKFGVNASEAGRRINELEESFDTPKVNTYEAQIKRLKAELSELGTKGFKQGDSEYDEVAKQLAQVTAQKKQYDKEMSKSAGADKGVKKLLQSLKGIKKTLQSATNSFAKFGKSASKGISGIVSMAGKLKNALVGTQKQANRMSFGQMIGSSVAFSFIFQGISAVQRAIKEGSDNLVQYSSVYNNSISGMASSLLYLKNAWAAAFAPIINVVAPLVSKFVDIVASALNAVGQFFSALTGKGTAVQAKKVWSDYGASLSDVGSGAKDASKGLDDAAKSAKDFQSYTLGIDELNIQPQTDNSTSSGVGGSGGGTGSEADGLAVSPTDMFETVSVDGAISEFAEKVKEAWRNADFTEIGAIIGTKLKSALENIPWEEIQAVSGKVGKSLATLINGFVEVEGLGYTIGETIGQAINTGLILVNTFLDNTHWDSVGTFIAEGLNGIVDTINWKGIGHFFAAKWNAIFETIGTASQKFDWRNLGKSLSDSVNTFISDFDWVKNGARLSDLLKGLLDSIISFLENTNWQELGNGIADFIGSIDWTGLVERLAEGIGAAIGGLFGLLWGFIEEAWGSVVQWWKDTAYEDGQFTIGGLFQGILDVISNIGAWIKEHIFQPFIDGFKKAFGIHSPSTVMAEQGLYIMQGLFNGISSLKEKVINFFSGIIEKIRVVFSPVIEFFSNTFSVAYQKIKDAWSFVTSWFHEKWEGIKNVFKDVINFFKEKFEGAYNAVKAVWSFVVSWFQEKWEGIKGAFKDVKDFFEGAFKSAYNAVTKVWEGIGDFFKKIANKAISPINSLVGGIIDAINWVGDALGVGQVVSPWTPIKFAKGSSGLPQDTVGIVNDQPGSTYKEMIVPPHGKPFIPEGRNVLLPMEKGTKIMPANQTKQLVDGVPHFAGGIGEFFGSAWSAIKDFTGTVWDYITNPGDLVKIAIDKFTNMTDFFQPWTTIAGGIVNKTFDSIVKFVSGIFEKAEGEGIEKAVRWAIAIANDDSHGYDQSSRWGNPDYDCSALVISAFEQAGIKLKSAGATYTGNMYEAAKSVGFADITDSVNRSTGSGMERGDILLASGNHTALYIGDGKVVQASQNEFGGIRGGKSGDQTGKEIWTTGYYNYPWTSILRYAKAYKDGIGRIRLSDLIPQYEVGGFPEDGLFMANHNELVGQFSNGRTAVANNADIQKGIEEAAYRGFSRANAENTRQESLLEELIQAVREGKKIVIDGRELVSITDQRRSRNGFSFT